MAQVVERGVRAASAARATIGGLGRTGVVSVREACGTESQPIGALSIDERALARLVVPWPRPLLRLALARLRAEHRRAHEPVDGGGKRTQNCGITQNTFYLLHVKR